MFIDPAAMEQRHLHHFLISVIVPRPIAFVSTVGADGSHNVAPFSYFNLISSRPPLVGISVNRRAAGPKDTARKVRETGEFVVNLVDEALSAKAVEASGEWPPDVDEFTLTGLTPARCEKVKAPRVLESPVNLECRLERVVEVGETDFIIGEVVWAHVRDDVLRDGRVDPVLLKPVGRLGGDQYTVVREAFSMPRPRVARPS
ncbi:MAG TPA: flavin reductase family protein [Candidatus Eisenbacteria bacterium]|nr:flavin reductase family protein [Candidatus Eisenbacteria bacterium]